MNPARFVAVAAIAVGVGWISPASAATIKVSTDPAIDNTGSPGWQVSPDGTSWASAVASFAFGTVGGIWDSSPAVETLFFRRTFGLSSAVLSASLFTGADDDVLSFSINGSPSLASDSDGSAGPGINLSPATSLFLLGSNTILAEVRNAQALTATFGVELTLNVAPVPLPAALPLLASTVVGASLLGIRRRRRSGMR